KMLGGKDMLQELHRHDFFFILVLGKGSGLHEIDFTPYTVIDHSVFLMRPGQVHKLALKAGSTGYLLQFKSDFLYFQTLLQQQLLRKVNHINFCNLGLSGFKKLDSILAHILKEYDEKQEGYHEVIASNLTIFFIELIRHRQNNEATKSKANAYLQEKLEKFIELLEKHLSDHKQVSEYAALLNLSVYQLNAITKTLLNKTSSELINENVILESKRQLLATSNQVSQIAYHLGYEDPSYFIRFFKKHTGATPEAFRQNSK